MHNNPHLKHFSTILDSAIAAADPALAVTRFLSVKDNTLVLDNGTSTKTFALNNYNRIMIIGIGKAAAAMATPLLDMLPGDKLCGIICTKYGHALKAEPLKVIEAGHPLPDSQSEKAALEAKKLLHDATENDLVIALVSGGGSSLLCAPASGLSLKHKTETNSLLLSCGADIHEINTVRKHLSLVKGGQLAKAAYPATVIALAISDVVGDDLSVIASGPFTADPTTWHDALDIVRKYKFEDRLPKPVMQHLMQGSTGLRAETPKPGESCFENVVSQVIASNRQSLLAAATRARQLGYSPLILSSSITGDTAAAAALHMAILREIHASGNPLAKPCCLISGGETTVTLAGNGLGGRNMEFVLHCVGELATMPDTLLASIGSDGTDGPTDAAGAYACADTSSRAEAAGIDVNEHLSGNDSYHFFDTLGQLVKTGPTRTNVMDIRLALIGHPAEKDNMQGG